MSRRRVVITGLGVVTSLGEVVDEMWEGVCAGTSGIKTITRWDTSKYPTKFGGECTNFDIKSPQYGIDKMGEKRLDRFGQFGLAASISAVKDAGIDFAQEDPYRCGVIIGSGSMTHDLSEFRGRALDTPAPDWVGRFADWFGEKLDAGRTDDLIDYRRQVPFAAKNHPSEDHLLPLFAALGTAGSSWRAERLHASVTYGILRMDVYAFHATSDARWSGADLTGGAPQL